MHVDLLESRTLLSASPIVAAPLRRGGGVPVAPPLGTEVVAGISRGGTLTLLGTDDDDSLEGALGDDCLYGQDGNDTLNGSADRDSVLGGDGDDTWVASVGYDT